MGDDVHEDSNLGYPLKIPDVPKTGVESWCMQVIIGRSAEGLVQLLPVAFSPEQAREIARRIMEWYGP